MSRRRVQRQRPCPTCGHITRQAYGYHCTVCDGRHAAKIPRGPTAVIRTTPEMQAWADALDRGREVSYPLAAAVWGCDLYEAIRRVNTLVRADILRGVSAGRFAWVMDERWNDEQ